MEGPVGEKTVPLGQKSFPYRKKIILGLQIIILRAKIYIFSLRIIIFGLKIKFWPWQSHFFLPSGIFLGWEGKDFMLMSFNSFVPSKHLLTFISTILPEHKDDNPQHLCAMKKTIISLFSLLCLLPCRAQLTIEDCYRQAESNYPLIRQYELIEKTKEYNLENAARGYLPQVAFSAQATYQSDVTHIPIDLNALGFPDVEIPSLSRDQYKAEISLNQTIWDGGTISSRRKTLRAQADVEQRDLDVSLYALRDRVNQLYFGILLTDARLRQNKVLQDELQRHCTQVASYIDNGIASQSDLDALRVDLLGARQDEAQLRHTRRAYVLMLGKFMGQELPEDVALALPYTGRSSFKANHRPELSLFDAQIRNLHAQDGQLTAGLMPRFSLFATGGYGKPGLDMFEDKFQLYGMAGVRLSWNISNFYTRKNDRRKIKAGIQTVETRRETFLFNTALDVAQRDADIDRYEEQLKYDDEIIALRRSVRQASEVKMANGTLSGTDLTRDIHAEQAAIQDKIVHEISLLKALYDRKYVTNN